MGWGITSPIVGVHWLRENGIACGKPGESTFALGAVTCPACRLELEGVLDMLDNFVVRAAMPGVASDFDLSDI
jgi:hypothetical protein